MGNEIKGPYHRERWEAQNESVVTGPGWENIPGTHTDREADKMAFIANLAYAEGYKEGRESRDAVVEAAKYVVSAIDDWKARLAVEELEKALAEDEKA